MIATVLTGGIGSGKSTVAAMLAQRGAVVIETDGIARALLFPEGACFARVVNRFGDAILDGSRSIDRAWLAQIVFNDEQARRDLESITHPEVHREVYRQLDQLRSADVVVVDIPLFVETGGRERYDLDGVLVVDTPEELAIARLVELRKMEEHDARARLSSQASRAERLKSADFIILNIGSLAELDAMADEAWRWMQSLGQAGERAKRES